MGITPGTEIEMISNSGGPLLVLVRSSRLCLCRSLGKAVVVE
jgi:Fe2+ transport system protein FeoA